MRDHVAAPLAARLHRADHVDVRVVLPPERERAVWRSHAHVRFLAEQQAALGRLARARVEAVFQHEDRFEATAQVLGAAQSPAALLYHAAQKTHGAVPGNAAAGVGRGGVAEIADALVDDAV